MIWDGFAGSVLWATTLKWASCLWKPVIRTTSPSRKSYDCCWGSARVERSRTPAPSTLLKKSLSFPLLGTAHDLPGSQMIWKAWVVGVVPTIVYRPCKYLGPA